MSSAEWGGVPALPRGGCESESPESLQGLGLTLQMVSQCWAVLQHWGEGGVSPTYRSARLPCEGFTNLPVQGRHRRSPSVLSENSEPLRAQHTCLMLGELLSP